MERSLPTLQCEGSYCSKNYRLYIRENELQISSGFRKPCILLLTGFMGLVTPGFSLTDNLKVLQVNSESVLSSVLEWSGILGS